MAVLCVPACPPTTSWGSIRALLLHNFDKGSSLLDYRDEGFS